MKPRVSASAKRFMWRCKRKGCGGILVEALDVPLIEIDKERWTLTSHAPRVLRDALAEAAPDVEITGDLRKAIFDARADGLLERADLLRSCPNCGQILYTEPITGKVAPQVVCSSKCVTSKSPDCVCSCGGARHGEAWRRRGVAFTAIGRQGQ